MLQRTIRPSGEVLSRCVSLSFLCSRYQEPAGQSCDPCRARRRSLRAPTTGHCGRFRGVSKNISERLQLQSQNVAKWQHFIIMLSNNKIPRHSAVSGPSNIACLTFAPAAFDLRKNCEGKKLGGNVAKIGIGAAGRGRAAEFVKPRHFRSGKASLQSNVVCVSFRKCTAFFTHFSRARRCYEAGSRECSMTLQAWNSAKGEFWELRPSRDATAMRAFVAYGFLIGRTQRASGFLSLTLRTRPTGKVPIQGVASSEKRPSFAVQAPIFYSRRGLSACLS